MESKTTYTGPGLLTFALVWGLVTQCLAWAGVIAWPWYAIWGPALAVLGFIAVVLLVIGMLFVAAIVSDK